MARCRESRHQQGRESKSRRRRGCGESLASSAIISLFREKQHTYIQRNVERMYKALGHVPLYFQLFNFSGDFRRSELHNLLSVDFMWLTRKIDKRSHCLLHDFVPNIFKGFSVTLLPPLAPNGDDTVWEGEGVTLFQLTRSPGERHKLTQLDHDAFWWIFSCKNVSGSQFSLLMYTKLLWIDNHEHLIKFISQSFICHDTCCVTFV